MTEDMLAWTTAVATGVSEAWAPFLAGGGVVLAFQALLAHVLRRRSGRDASLEGLPRGDAAVLEVLGSLEARIDARLRRLESCLAGGPSSASKAAAAAADGLREPPAHPSQQPSALVPAPAVAGPASPLPPWAPPWAAGDDGEDASTASIADRARVLSLARLGRRPEAFAGRVGLLRGEVDLILRLHESAERSRGPGAIL